MMRALILGLLLVIGSLSTATAQETRRTTVLVGFGGIEHGAELGPAYHLNVRHTLAAWDSVTFAISRIRPRTVLDRVALGAELFGQTGRSGDRSVECLHTTALCPRVANPLQMLGIGIVSRIDTSVGRPVQFYYLPATAGIFLRNYTLLKTRRDADGDIVERLLQDHLRAAGGFGTGWGLSWNLDRLVLSAELRAIVTYDLEGETGGSVPLSVGISW